jgi:hypothetical protein
VQPNKPLQPTSGGANELSRDVGERRSRLSGIPLGGGE